MSTYILHINWTDQGIRRVKDSPTRLDAAKMELKKMGGKLKAFYLTQGMHDALIILEVPNDMIVARFLLELGSRGNVRTTTVKAYSEAEYRKIIASLS